MSGTNTSFTLAAGVFFNWLDAGLSPTAIATSIGAFSFHANRGSLQPKQLSGYDDFQDEYGVSNYNLGGGWDAARGFFRVGQAAVGVRSPGVGAKYAASICANNKLVVPVKLANPSGYAYDGTSITPIGSLAFDYSQVNLDSWDMIFSHTLAATATIQLTINGTQTAVVTSNGNQVVTLNNLATEINNVLQALTGVTDYSGAAATVINRPSVANVDSNDPATTPRTIRITGPQNTPLTITAITVVGDVLTTVTAIETEWLFYSVAENPGQWGNNVAQQIAKLQLGVNSSVKMQFAAMLDPLNGFNVNVNGVSIVVPPNGAGNNALLTDIATAINANVPNVTAVVQNVNGVNNNRAIVLTANINTVVVSIQSPTIIKNAALGTPPNVIVATVRTQFVPSTDFVFNTYEYPNLRTVTDSWAATFVESVNANGAETDFTMLVNNGNSSSNSIRVYVNPLATIGEIGIQSATVVNYLTGDGFMGGGVDGALSASSDIIEAWNLLSDPNMWSVRILMNCGYSTIDVQQAMELLCQSRRDCVAILDLDIQSQGTAQSCVDYRNNLNINSSYVALYSPNIKIYDVDYRTLRYAAPSGYVGAIYAYTDMTTKTWYSPAGLTRGWIPEGQGLYVNYAANDNTPNQTGSDMSLLASAQINPIINYRGQQITVFGDWTLYMQDSPFQYIGTRRMCNAIELMATQTVAYSLFEPNTIGTRSQVVNVSNTMLQSIQDGQGINTFQVVDLTTSANVDARGAYFRYIIDPTTSIHQIVIDGYIVRDSSSFTEYTTLTPNNGVVNSPLPIAA